MLCPSNVEVGRDICSVRFNEAWFVYFLKSLNIFFSEIGCLVRPSASAREGCCHMPHSAEDSADIIKEKAQSIVKLEVNSFNLTCWQVYIKLTKHVHFLGWNLNFLSKMCK